MSIEEFMAWVGSRPLVPAIFFIGVPVLSWIACLTHDRKAAPRNPWRWILSILVFVACIPGVFAAVIVAYTFLFTRENLLELDLIVTFLPIISMIATLVVIARHVDLDHLPGFDRLWGLIMLLTLSFVIALVLDRLRIWIVFGGGMISLVLIAAIMFAALHVVAKSVFGRRRRA